MIALPVNVILFALSLVIPILVPPNNSTASLVPSLPAKLILVVPVGTSKSYVRSSMFFVDNVNTAKS